MDDPQSVTVRTCCTYHATGGSQRACGDDVFDTTQLFNPAFRVLGLSCSISEGPHGEIYVQGVTLLGPVRRDDEKSG